METDRRQLRQLCRRLYEAICQGNPSNVNQAFAERRSCLPLLDLDDEWVRDDDKRSLTYLQHAVCWGSVDIARALIDEGAGVNAGNKKGQTALWIACKQASSDGLTMVKYLLRWGADVDTPTDLGCTPLMVACEESNIALVNMLLRANANADYTDCQGDSALHIAFTSGVSATVNKVVDALARHGCDVNQVNKNRLTPVMMAAQEGWTDVIQTLLLAGCDLNCVDLNHCTALGIAAKKGHTNAVRLLLQNGADPTIADHKKTTPLLHAVKVQYSTTVDTILSSPMGLSSINMADYEGTTPILHSSRAACQFGAAAPHCIAGEMTTALLDKGCNVNIAHKATGWTPLFAAALTGNTSVAELLLEAGADVGLLDNSGDTVLHSAMNLGSLNMVKLLVEAGCDVNIQNNSGVTAMYKAVARRCQLEIIEYIIDSGGGLEATHYTSNTTALHAAVSPPLGYPAAALLLIEKGCNINHCDAMGTSALTKSLQYGHSDVTKYLLSLPHCNVNAGTHAIPLHAAVSRTEEHLINQLVQLGADINKTDQRGLRPIQIAVEAFQRRIIKALLRLGCSLDPTEAENLVVPKSCCHQHHDSHPHTELQPLFAAVKYDDLDTFMLLLSRYYRKPYKLLQTLHDMLTIAFDLGNGAGQMLSSAGRTQLLDLLREQLANPSTLQELCRGEIRLNLGVHTVEKVQVLHLPTRLKCYLLFDTDRHLDLTDLDEEELVI